MTTDIELAGEAGRLAEVADEALAGAETGDGEVLEGDGPPPARGTLGHFHRERRSPERPLKDPHESGRVLGAEERESVATLQVAEGEQQAGQSHEVLRRTQQTCGR